MKKGSNRCSLFFKPNIYKIVAVQTAEKSILSLHFNTYVDERSLLQISSNGINI
ncbi:hypothetical protein QE439_004481 [Pedobacter agri]|nr:hypothetical protein [Pedobacter agri]